jgi:hypothetical protein
MIRFRSTPVWGFCLLLGFFSEVQAQSPSRLTTDVDEMHTAMIEDALNSRISVEYSDTSLTDAIGAWREEFGINFHVDRTALEDSGLNAAELPLSANLKNVRFESLLQLLLEEHDLSFSPRADHILITTPDRLQYEQLVVRVYPVQDLVLTIRGGRVEQDFTSLRDVIMSAISVDTWDEYGGYGSLEPVPASGVLVVNQTWHVHQRLAALLAAIRESRDAQGIPALPPTLQADSPEPGKFGAVPHGGFIPVVGQGAAAGPRHRAAARGRTGVARAAGRERCARRNSGRHYADPAG